MPFRSRWHAPALAAMITLLTTGPASGQSQSSTKIVGCVMDDSFLALPGVEVSLVGADGRRTVTTTSDGCYQLTDVPQSTYSLSAQERLFVPQTRAVNVEGQPTLIFDFVLKFKPGVVREPPLVVVGRPNASVDVRGKINGCVTDGSGTPLPRAVVTGAGTNVLTDQTGCFSIAVAPGSYRLRARVDESESPEAGPIVVAAGERLRCPVLVLNRSGRSW